MNRVCSTTNVIRSPKLIASSNKQGGKLAVVCVIVDATEQAAIAFVPVDIVETAAVVAVVAFVVTSEEPEAIVWLPTADMLIV